MALYKLVNGIQVECSSDEASSIEAEWIANALKKENHEKNFGYKDKRRKLYPSVEDQLEMIYDDKINDTTTWVDAITAINNLYPKPKE